MNKYNKKEDAKAFVEKKKKKVRVILHKQLDEKIQQK